MKTESAWLGKCRNAQITTKKNTTHASHAFGKFLGKVRWFKCADGTLAARASSMTKNWGGRVLGKTRQVAPTLCLFPSLCTHISSKDIKIIPPLLPIPSNTSFSISKWVLPNSHLLDFFSSPSDGTLLVFFWVPELLVRQWPFCAQTGPACVFCVLFIRLSRRFVLSSSRNSRSGNDRHEKRDRNHISDAVLTRENLPSWQSPAFLFRVLVAAC